MQTGAVTNKSSDKNNTNNIQPDKDNNNKMAESSNALNSSNAMKKE